MTNTKGSRDVFVENLKYYMKNHRTKEELSSIFSRNLIYYMEEKGTDIVELAKVLGVSYSAVSEWTKGIKYPRIDKIQILADFFNVSLSDLIEDKMEQTRSQEELLELREKLRKHPELKKLLDLSSQLSKRDMMIAIRTLEALTESK